MMLSQHTSDDDTTLTLFKYNKQYIVQVDDQDRVTTNQRTFKKYVKASNHYNHLLANYVNTNNTIIDLEEK